MSVSITCPICGKRNGYEFRFGGEDRGAKPGESVLADPKAWCDYVHMNECKAGVQKEWWCHKDGCGKWFCIERNTVLNAEVN